MAGPFCRDLSLRTINTLFMSYSLQGDGLCDRRKRTCKKVTVMGSGFLNSTNMTCHVKEFTVTLLTFFTLLFQCFYIAAAVVVVVFPWHAY